MSELLSVVIPSYNHAEFVGAAIASVIAQTYEPIELIVVDDGSSDGSADVVRAAVDDAPLERVEVVEQENRGAHETIMRGVGLARGRLLSILNSDDAYHPQRFARLVPRLDPDSDGLAFSGVAFIDGGGQALPPDNSWPQWYGRCLVDVRRSPTVSYALLTHNFSVTSGNFLFTRSLYDRLGGLSRHRFAHDWDFLIRSCYYCEPVFVPDRLIDYRIHGANTTESVRHLIIEECSEGLGRYLELFGRGPSPNPLAPHPSNWPSFFEAFAAATPAFFEAERRLADVIERLHSSS